MEPWILYTVSATVLYGALNFLFKMAAEQGCEADRLVSVVGLTVALLAFGTMLLASEHPFRPFTWTVLAYAFVNGSFFALGSLAKVGALKRAPAAIVFPLNRLNTVAVMAIGFLFFHEVARPVQWLGVATGLGVLALITYEQRAHFRATGDRARVAGIVLALAGALFTALSMTAGKLLAESASDRIAYICVSYALVFLFTLGQQSVARREEGGGPRLPDRTLLRYGVAVGILNYAGYYLVLQAFGSGPISLSQAIFSSSIIIPILLSRVVYREHLTPLRLVAIALAILSVMFIGLR